MDIANILTSRTVETYATYMCPFGTKFESHVTAKLKLIFNKLMKDMENVEGQIDEDNKVQPEDGYKYISMKPSNIDISLSI